jgi:hypothetical protein
MDLPEEALQLRASRKAIFGQGKRYITESAKAVSSAFFGYAPASADGYQNNHTSTRSAERRWDQLRLQRGWAHTTQKVP